MTSQQSPQQAPTTVPAKRAVEVGLGIALVPRVTVATEALAGVLKQLELAGERVERPIGIVTRKSGDLSLPAQKFIDTLLSPSR